MTLRLIHHVPPLRREGAQGGASRSSLAPLTRPQDHDGDHEARCAAAEPQRVTPPRPARWRPSSSLVLTPFAVVVVGLVLLATAVMDSFRRQK